MSWPLMNSALQGVERPLTYSLIRVIDVYDMLWTVGDPWTAQYLYMYNYLSNSQVYKLIILIITAQC